MRPSELLPLFPLGLVLFPESHLPLHIFETRYRQMVDECLQRETPFGVVLEVEGERADVGCSAEIVELLQRHPDGRIDIMTAGRTPFRIVETDDSLPLLRADVEWLEEPDEDVSAARSEVLELYRATFHGLPGASPPSDIESAAWMSYQVGGSLLSDTGSRQQLLAMSSEGERLRHLSRLLKSVGGRVRAVAGNGRGH